MEALLWLHPQPRIYFVLPVTEHTVLSFFSSFCLSFFLFLYLLLSFFFFASLYLCLFCLSSLPSFLPFILLSSFLYFFLFSVTDHMVRSFFFPFSFFLSDFFSFFPFSSVLSVPLISYFLSAISSFFPLFCPSIIFFLSFFIHLFLLNFFLPYYFSFLLFSLWLISQIEIPWLWKTPSMEITDSFSRPRSATWIIIPVSVCLDIIQKSHGISFHSRHA